MLIPGSVRRSRSAVHCRASVLGALVLAGLSPALSLAAGPGTAGRLPERTAVSAAVQPKAGPWLGTPAGETQPPVHWAMRPDHRTVYAGGFTYQARCANGTVVHRAITFNGKLSGRRTLHESGSFTVRVSSHRLWHVSGGIDLAFASAVRGHGSYRNRIRITNPRGALITTCDTGRVKFDAGWIG